MIFAVNTGSASKKYALYDNGHEILRIHLELENGKFIANIKFGESATKQEISDANFNDSINLFLALALTKGAIKDKSEIERIGIRIVAPGEYFYSHNTVDQVFIEKLKDAREFAPLHIDPIITELVELEKNLHGVPVVAVSDSAFHISLPDNARFYAIPKNVADKFGIFRFGYHGISVSSVLRGTEKLLGKIPEKIIVCHLGSGASITAVKNGESFDTSMGLTQLEGLPMGTRVGDIDPGAVIVLGQKLNLNYLGLEEYLNKQCGLLGLSKNSSDIRELLAAEEKGDKDAKRALEFFVYKIKKYIGAYASAMGGVDLLVFTATAGERSFVLRERICGGLEFLNIVLDLQKNKAVAGSEAIINSGVVKIAVVPTDELGEIATETALAEL